MAKSLNGRAVMGNLTGCKSVMAFVLFCTAMSTTTVAQTFNNLASFDDTNGSAPDAALVQGTDGNFYATASMGGLNGNGTIFGVTPDGSLNTIYNFCSLPGCTDAAYPLAALILSIDGYFYGTTDIGGANYAGAIYKINSRGIFTTIHSFDVTDGASPQAPLIQASDGNFYGTTIIGGHYPHRCGGNYCGTVFKITAAGALESASFDLADGAQPEGPLTQAADGNFYGTTPQGGSSSSCGNAGCGTVFKATPAGDLSAFYSFCSQSSCADGYQPIGGLVQGTDGNFYGTTSAGGTDLTDCVTGCGTVFKITPDGALMSLHSFSLVDGAYPLAGLIQATDGNFYGTTSQGGDLACHASNDSPGCGTVFQITPAGTLTTLHSLELTDGAYPEAPLFQATNGDLYGSAFQGGDLSCNTPYGCGSIFTFSMGLGPFVSFVHSSGKAGQTGGILGQGFTGTTAVTLNGTPANFTVVSDTFIKATVPAGATTGYVTVATPSGTLTSNVPFYVLP